jgi:L-serine dehydratase
VISALDLFRIGIGPSSSHTVGPMRAALRFAGTLLKEVDPTQLRSVRVELFGSLGQTGRGHGTDKALILGLAGHRPDTVDPSAATDFIQSVVDSNAIRIGGELELGFPPDSVVFHQDRQLPGHSNGMQFSAYDGEQLLLQQTWYSIGGGFIVSAAHMYADCPTHPRAVIKDIPYPFRSADGLLKHCRETGLSISSLMLRNEGALRPDEDVCVSLARIWETMKDCIARGCREEGILPGALRVTRRAPALYRRLVAEDRTNRDPLNTMDWVNLYALAVNEENAAGGRVVTAPTNGAAGIIPAVLSYYDRFVNTVDDETCSRFLLTAAAIGILYKANASISGAEVGCQGEVGVACSMAAGALAALMGGTPEVVENAAEIGMEHNLGLTCDPVGGLVQVPCIERNAMGAVKAVNAARLALRGSGEHKVSLDKVIKTMWETGRDMRTKYKETAKGGLAVNLIEC